MKRVIKKFLLVHRNDQISKWDNCLWITRARQESRNFNNTSYSIYVFSMWIKIQQQNIVTVICRNDELSWTMSWVGCLLIDSVLFILFAENSQILLKISVTPILLIFIYLVALNLSINNLLNSPSNSTHHWAHNCHTCVFVSRSSICFSPFLRESKFNNKTCVFVSHSSIYDFPIFYIHYMYNKAFVL